jgi:hypothetical protein
MVNEVKKLTTKTNPTAILQDMAKAIDDIEQLEQKLKVMMAHGDALDNEMQDLLNQVKNFFSARTQERKQFINLMGDTHLLTLLTGPGYFTQETMEFPKGASMFVPGQKNMPKNEVNGAIVVDDGMF